MYGKSNMETYITTCKIDGQQEFALWLRKLKQGLRINLQWWDGEGNGREVQKGGDMCIPMTDLMNMSLSEFRELVMDREAWRAVIHGSQRVGHN